MCFLSSYENTVIFWFLASIGIIHILPSFAVLILPVHEHLHAADSNTPFLSSLPCGHIFHGAIPHACINIYILYSQMRIISKRI